MLRWSIPSMSDFTHCAVCGSLLTSADGRLIFCDDSTKPPTPQGHICQRCYQRDYLHLNSEQRQATWDEVLKAKAHV